MMLSGLLALVSVLGVPYAVAGGEAVGRNEHSHILVGEQNQGGKSKPTSTDDEIYWTRMAQEMEMSIPTPGPTPPPTSGLTAPPTSGLTALPTSGPTPNICLIDVRIPATPCQRFRKVYMSASLQLSITVISFV